MRKNGWRFRPSQGAFDRNKLVELKEILSGETPIVLTEGYCRRIFTDYNTLSREDHKTDPKSIFIRTYKNYMEKLKIIHYENDTITLTSLGTSYIATDDANLNKFLIKALTEYTWFGVPIKDYLFEILEYTDKKLCRDEILLFIRHAGIKDYSHHTPYDIAKLILCYRNLNDREKERINKLAETEFNKTDTSRSKTSWFNMSGNALTDIIDDVSIFDEIERIDDYLKYKNINSAIS